MSKQKDAPARRAPKHVGLPKTDKVFLLFLARRGTPASETRGFIRFSIEARTEAAEWARQGYPGASWKRDKED